MVRCLHFIQERKMGILLLVRTRETESERQEGMCPLVFHRKTGQESC